MPPIIIDRRANPGKKNLSNRQRFIERFKGKIADSAKKIIGKRSITNNGDQEVSIPTDIDEPRFNHKNDSGDWDYVLPGNEEYLPGDTIDKPRGGSGGGSGGGRLPDRAGYCAVSGNYNALTGKAYLPGQFLDLEFGQPDKDPSVRGATLAVWGEGMGITCDALVLKGFKASVRKVNPSGITGNNLGDIYVFYARPA